MRYRNSSWNGRAAHSLSDAFGPHTSTVIHDPEAGRRIADRALYLVSAFAFLFVIALIALEHL